MFQSILIVYLVLQHLGWNMKHELLNALEEELRMVLDNCDQQEVVFLEIAALAQELVTHAQLQRAYVEEKLSRLYQVSSLLPRHMLAQEHDYLNAVHEE